MITDMSRNRKMDRGQKGGIVSRFHTCYTYGSGWYISREHRLCVYIHGIRWKYRGNRRNGNNIPWREHRWIDTHYTAKHWRLNVNNPHASDHMISLAIWTEISTGNSREDVRSSLIAEQRIIIPSSAPLQSNIKCSLYGVFMVRHHRLRRVKADGGNSWWLRRTTRGLGILCCCQPLAEHSHYWYSGAGSSWARFRRESRWLLRRLGVFGDC